MIVLLPPTSLRTIVSFPEAKRSTERILRRQTVLAAGIVLLEARWIQR